MQAARDRLKPKHQVLILKCYPRFQKGVSEVKPHPSELSYLLYYASTRRSKIQKVGAYLEKKSSNDIWRHRIGNVQVTLHIIRALIEKSPRDLPLYGLHVLRILNQILKSDNATVIEDSIPAFEAFCENHDVALLTADPEILKEFDNLILGYATLASKPQSQTKVPRSKIDSLKRRTVGLQAIKCVTSSEAIGTNPLYIDTILPAVLDTLHAESDDWLVSLRQKGEEGKELARRRRMSTATAQTVDSVPEEPVIATTTADADRQGEEEAGLLAYDSLEHIYSSSNRLQLRWATSALLKFITRKPLGTRPDTVRPSTSRTTSTQKSARTGNWNLTLLEAVTQWAPVQDRFVILTSVCEALVQSSVTEENMHHQLVLASAIEWLLGSKINMIGLSVMDILLALVQHILSVLQLGSREANALPFHQPTDAIDLFEKSQNSGHGQDLGEGNTEAPQPVTTPSVVRQELLNKLRRSIGNLATHIYYSDQVRDIITAVLLRLKPPVNSGLAGAAAAIERPDEAVQAIADSARISENPETDQFFSFGTARVAALNAIRDVLMVANNKGLVTGAGAVGRSRVGASVWEGTQWLLRDEDKRVRRAYVEALLTWLKLEVSMRDFQVIEETSKSKKKSPSTEKNGKDISRSASNASPNHKKGKVARSTFLQLLHLSVYDNALEAPEDDSSILLLHLLLASLARKLGVNAVRSGLPMMVRLQEDINMSSQINTPKAKVNVGSLVHGYLWALSESFDFDTTLVGFQIQSEISRRRKSGLWLDAVSIPPKPLDVINSAGPAIPQAIPQETADNESLKPFDNIGALVQQVAVSYASTLSSPPGSPPLSPGRVYTMPLTSVSGQHKPANELPTEFKDAMLSKWTKESCIAAAEKSHARTASPHGSRSGTTRSGRNGLLTADGAATQRDPSPSSAHPHSRTRGRIPSAFRPIQTAQANRADPVYSGPQTPVSDTSNHTGTLRVDDLKRVLAGGALADAFSSQRQSSSVRNSSPLRNSQTATQDFAAEGDRLGRTITRPSVISVGTESMVDAEGFESASEGDLDHPLPTPQPPADRAEVAREYENQLGRRPYDQSPSRSTHASDKGKHVESTSATVPVSPSRKSHSGRPRSASETSTEDPEANVRALRGGHPGDIVHGNMMAEEGVPPVPPLPEGLLKSNALAAANGNTSLPAQPSPTNPNIASMAKDQSATRDNLTVENRPTTSNAEGSVNDESARGSLLGSVQDSVGRSVRSSGPEKSKAIQALLGSIEVSDVGGKGIGTPPY